MPFGTRLFLDYILSPIATSGSVLGTLIILFFLTGRFAAEPIRGILPSVGNFLYSTGIPEIALLASPVYAVLIGLALILMGGLLKRIADKIRERIISGNPAA